MKFAGSPRAALKLAFLFNFFLLAAVFFGSAIFAFGDAKEVARYVSVKSRQQKISKKGKHKNRKSRIKKRRKKHEKPLREIARPQIESEFEADAEKREEWFLAQRTYPFSSISDNARQKAWAARPVDARAGDSPTLARWQSIGPTPTTSYFPGNWGLTSGRINTIAVSASNPQLILIGAATGGIWRSTDGGATFTPVSDNQVDLAVGSIAFAPSDNSIVYAGMGDKDNGYMGTGVLKSTDGGQSWTKISSNLPAPGRISKIEVDASDPNRVCVAQLVSLGGNNNYSSGFWYSTDGGVNWTKTFGGLARDLVRHPLQPNTFYLAMQRVDPNNQAGGVFKSTDAGLTWTRIYTSPFATTSNIKIAVTPAAPQNLYVLVGGTTAQVEVSADEGATWTNRGGSGFDIGQFGYNCYLYIHPTAPNTIFVGTRDLWRSTDGGVNYSNITGNFSVSGGYTPAQAKAHPDQHNFYISPTNPNSIYLSNDGGIWHSTDGANTFQSLNASLSLTMFTSLAINPNDPTRSYGGTQDNGTQKRGGGSGWREFSTGDGGQIVVDAVDPSIVYTTYVYNAVFRNNNNGDSFGGTIGSDATFNSDRVAFYPPFTGNSSDSTLYFGTYRLYVSTNRGASWTAPAGTLDLTNGGTLSAIGVGRSNTNVIYTGSSDGRVMVSTNAGASWTDATANIPNRFVKSIVVAPTDSSVAYLTVSGYDSGHVFKTTNTGASWTDISGNLPNIPTNTLLIDPRSANTLYVGTDIGVFRSITDSTNWETFNFGLPPAIVTKLVAQTGGLMQAATYGRGAFETNLNDSAARKEFDFDGDGRADISVFRATNGSWYLNESSSGFKGVQFGSAADKPVPADYDGDGKADIAVYRNGVWYIQQSSLGFTGIAFGAPDDIPVAADFDGDGRADIGVFRPSTGTWYIYNLATNQYRAYQFGQAGDIPVVGDYDGDGKADIAVYRPSSGTWYLNESSNGFVGVQFGAATDKPVPSDYDGDGKTDIAVFRPENGTWYLLESTKGFTGMQFGVSTDKPVPADYDGDGKTDIAVYRNGTWYLQQSANGFVAISFGAADDSPVPAAFIP